MMHHHVWNVNYARGDKTCLRCGKMRDMHDNRSKVVVAVVISAAVSAACAVWYYEQWR